MKLGMLRGEAGSYSADGGGSFGRFYSVQSQATALAELPLGQADTSPFRPGSANLPNLVPEPISPLLRPVMPELDSIRGVAILLVVFYHGFGDQYGTVGLTGMARLWVSATMMGWVGVNLFFVLSGFLISGILLDSKLRADYYKRFYLRRAVRILPAYYALLIVLAVLPRAGLMDRPVSWGFLGLSAIYLANVTRLLGIPMHYGPLWSLAVEEQFYLLWPGLVKRVSKPMVAKVALGILVASPIIRAASCYWGWGCGQAWTWQVADGLAAGSLLAVLIRGPLADRTKMMRFASGCVGIGGAIIVAGIPFGILSSATLAGKSLQFTVLDLFATAALGFALLWGTGSIRLQGLVRLRLFRFLGEISYGLYLIHTLVWDLLDHFAARYLPYLAVGVQGHILPMLLRFSLGAGMAIVLAWLSRHTLEQYFLRWKDRDLVTQRSAAKELDAILVNSDASVVH